MKNYRVALIYLGVALVVLGPLLRPGYVLTLDMVFVPHPPLPGAVSSSYLEQLAIWAASHVLPGYVVQKLMLLAILWLAGYGAHRLARWCLAGSAGAGAYLAGIFYVLNPFSYDRLISGQYNVLFGYALLPWFVVAFVRCVERPQWRRALVMAAWLTAISVVSIHSVLLAVLVGLAIFARYAWSQRKQRDTAWFGGVARSIGLVAGIWLAASSYWLVPLLAGQSRQAALIDSFTSGDRSAFMTSGAGWLEHLGYVGRLQGFWAERHGIFILPQHAIDGWLWWTALALLWGLVALGALAWWRSGRRGDAMLFVALIVVAGVLASGIGNGWLAAHVPLYAGYREPQKFVALMILGMVPLLAAGYMLAERRFIRVVGSGWRLMFRTAGLLLPVVLASSMLWGAAGQLRAAHYPDGWQQIDRQLAADPHGGATIFVPWHLYLYMGFAGRVSANPAPYYFQRPVLVSNDAELKGVAPSSDDKLVRQVGQVLAKRDANNLADDLRKLGVRYVVFAMTSDYENYEFVRQAPGLEKVADYPDIQLYRIK